MNTSSSGLCSQLPQRDPCTKASRRSMIFQLSFVSCSTKERSGKRPTCSSVGPSPPAFPKHIDPDESNKVINVVTQVQRLSKSVAGFEDTYNRMSEFVHPNAYGSVVHFHSMEGDDAVFYEKGKPSTQGLSYLILASFLSALFVANVTEIESRLKAITA
jgi:hypothetical protein